ncbi:MAG: presenilin family intramembrane aspartyl protease [archaeon]|nr:presenilin family intramembrane aspartyl protease [archaeon]
MQLFAVFFATQAIGLITAQNLLMQGVSVTIVNEDKESLENSFGLFGYILLFTAVLLVLLRVLKGKRLFFVLKALEIMAVFSTSIIVFSIISETAGIIAGLAMVVARIAWPKNVWLRNTSSVIAGAGAGALIGVSIGVLPVIVFIILLAAYDYIAVFKTKHMVEIAKNVAPQNMSFTYALPTKDHQFELGTGDIVIPLAFASSVLAENTQSIAPPAHVIAPILIILASFAGLFLTLEYLSKRIGIALPALPPQTILMIIAFGIARVSGF